MRRARVLSKVTTPWSMTAEITRRAAFASADDGGCAAIEPRFEDVVGLGRELVEPNFLFSSEQEARAGLVGLLQPFHDRHLFEAERGLTGHNACANHTSDV
jgi:hypothetical protein